MALLTVGTPRSSFWGPRNVLYTNHYVTYGRMSRAPSQITFLGAQIARAGQWLDQNDFSEEFFERVLAPSLSHIFVAQWSSQLDAIRKSSALFTLNFLWEWSRTEKSTAAFYVDGGSSRLYEKFKQRMQTRQSVSLRLATAVNTITRGSGGLTVSSSSGSPTFSAVVMATDAATTKKISSPNWFEAWVLSQTRYTTFDVCVHSDQDLVSTSLELSSSPNFADKTLIYQKYSNDAAAAGSTSIDLTKIYQIGWPLYATINRCAP